MSFFLFFSSSLRRVSISQHDHSHFNWTWIWEVSNQIERLLTIPRVYQTGAAKRAVGAGVSYFPGRSSQAEPYLALHCHDWAQSGSKYSFFYREQNWFHVTAVDANGAIKDDTEWHRRTSRALSVWRLTVNLLLTNIAWNRKPHHTFKGSGSATGLCLLRSPLWSTPTQKKEKEKKKERHFSCLNHNTMLITPKLKHALRW